jgi:ubiquinone biosynthesis protein
VPLSRLLTILRVFARYRLDDLLPRHPATLPLRALLRLFPGTRDAEPDPWVRLRLACEELGPVFIKFGQLLSTRRDLLSEEAANDLARLQDRVPPFASAEAAAIVERELKKPLTEVFGHFDMQPLASASVAQVHAGTLKDGREIVVKILRPDIRPIVERDMALLAFGARWLERVIPETRRFHPAQVVADYEHILLGELDLVQEAANATQFRRNFADSPLLYVPEVHWQFTTLNVMVMERIYGVPVSDVAAMEAAGVDRKTLAEIGVEIFFTQVFRDNFFHADMHPGNVMVSLAHPGQPQYLSLDCAIAGSLSKQERFLLARQLMALLDKDYEQMAILLIEAGWVPPKTSIQAFGNALRTVLEPVLERPLNEIEFGPILVRLFQTARRFEMQALPQFMLLEKTLLHVEGLGRTLYPELDIWTIGRPLLENWIREQIGPTALWQHFKRNAPALFEQVPHLPKLAWDALNEVRQLSSNQQRLIADIEERHLRQWRRDRLMGLLGSGALVVGMLWSMKPELIPSLASIETPAWLMGIAGLALLLGRAWRKPPPGP